jgi:hypothetical protein
MLTQWYFRGRVLLVSAFIAVIGVAALSGTSFVLGRVA